jgi:biopolymer transport protein ExbB
MENNFGLAHYWSQSDTLGHIVAITLLMMSIVSWYLILFKAWMAWRIRSTSQATESFWDAPTLNDATQLLSHHDKEKIFSPLAVQSIRAANLQQKKENINSLNANIDPSEVITRTLRQEINRVSSRLENGLTILASIGSTAPFVGLLGTVWGIYHALISIAAKGAIEIDKITGPVGEALIMTALGLIVAIHAVLAYNAFTRINRLTLAKLDAFAHDLHAYLTIGTRSHK